MIYLDWAATAPLNAKIMDQSLRLCKDIYGNPSSIHYQGREAEKILGHSRNTLAKCLNCRESEIFFTSGGTESNNMVFFSLLKKGKGLNTLKDKEVIISGIEHPAAFKPAQSLKNFGLNIKVVNAEKNGQVDPEKIKAALSPQTLMVSLMYVNNETGAVQPVKQVAEIIKQWNSQGGRRILFHSDMVQAFGKIPVDLEELNVDFASFSAHKLGGPKGIGALYVKRKLQLQALYQGGEQEFGVRPGTENLLGIHALALLADELSPSIVSSYLNAQNKMKTLIQALKLIPEVELIPHNRLAESPDYSPCILKFAIPPVPGEVIVRVMEDKGFLVSTGSACSNKEQDKKFRVLKNMGVSMNLAASCIRVSFGDATSVEDLLGFVDALKMELPPLLNLAKHM